MRPLFLFLFSFVCTISSWCASVVIDFPLSMLGRDYVIASRVERIDRPMEHGKMKINAGMRVYNPQLVHFTLEGDSLVMSAADSKRGPQRVSMPASRKSESMLCVSMDSLFLPTLRGVDINVTNTKKGKITMVKGDASHMEVSVSYDLKTYSADNCITIRKSLLLLKEKPMESRAIDKRLGFKSNDNKHINRFDINNGKDITFIVSNQFPALWQDAIRQGIEDWNIAFARIGKSDIIKAVKQEEAGKDFDPFDINVNYFNMVESDFANAQGNHWTDPRSGEIIQADVQFYSNVAEKLRTWLLLHTSAYNKDVADGDVSDSLMTKMIRYAAAHEIGHCLGLEHNYRASFAYPTDSLRNEAFCMKNGTTPSIMDYARFNYVAQKGDEVKSVFPPILGEYDMYAIEAGYGAFKDDNEYKSFIDKKQNDARHLYRKMSVSALPNDAEVQQTDLGNDHLKSSAYGIRNIAEIPSAVLTKIKADDIHAFYFQLLMHLVPSLNREEVKEFLENEINNGYKILNSPKMQHAYGNQAENIEKRRSEFVSKVTREYDLHIINDPLSAGMWMPQQMVTDDVFSLLKKDGLKLSKKDIYNINKHCLAGAALSLSTSNGVSTPFATASFVSKDGLVMTNFHCVSNHVQRLAKGDNDYMKYGCWASSREQEAPLFGLELHQLLSVEDVTAEVMKGTEGMSDDERDATADKQARQMMSGTNEKYGISRKIYSLMGGQQYVMARYRTFTDVRIAACPPMWLGAYGGDDDNWRWPRYSCDFAFLRVYVAADGESAEYDKENVPYHPSSFLKVAKSPIKEGDLAMVMGYPSQTRKEIPAYALDKIVNKDTQLRANFLKAKIDFLKERSKNAIGTDLSGYNVRIGKMMNVYLRSKGEIDGVRSTGLVDIKRREDMRLQEWINADEGRKARYGGNLIAKMDSVYSRLTEFNHMDEAFSQFVGSGAGIIPFAGKFEKLMAINKAKRKSKEKDMEEEIKEIRRNIREFFPSISMEEDCGMMKRTLPLYLKAVKKDYLPAALLPALGADTDKFVEHLYSTSLLTDSARLETFLGECIEKGTEELHNDSLYRICIDIYANRVQKQNRLATPLRRQNTKLYGLYMRAKNEMNAGKTVPYEANHTLRFSAGRIKDINNIGDMTRRNDFLSAKFKEALNDNPSIACFTTNAETAAGNSGSAVLNAKGELIGLNFDRTAESASSIYRSNPMKIRNIAVSMEYILWVIKNLSYSQYLLNEIK